MEIIDSAARAIGAAIYVHTLKVGQRQPQGRRRNGHLVDAGVCDRELKS